MLKNGFYNLIGSLLATIIGIVSTPTLIRILGLENYGLWILVSSTLVLIGVAEGGLASSSTYFVSKDLKSQDTTQISSSISIIGISMLMLACLVSLSCYSFAPVVGNLFVNLDTSQSSSVVTSLKIGSIAVWGRMIQGVFVGIEQALNQYAFCNTLNTIQRLINNISIIVIAWISNDIIEMIKIQVILSLIILAVHFIVVSSFLKKLNSFRFSFKFIKINRVKEILKYSFSTWITTLGNVIFSQLDKVVLGGILGVQLLGVYAAITRISSQINNLSGTAVQPILPSISGIDLSLPGNRIRLIKGFNEACILNTSITVILGSTIILFSPEVSQILFSKEYTVEYLYAFQTSIIIYSLYSVNAFSYYFLLGISDVSFVMANVIISSVLTLVLIYLGATFFGLYGAILGNIGFISILFLTLRSIQTLKIDKLSYFNLIKYDCLILISYVVISSSMLKDDYIYIRIVLLLFIVVLYGVKLFRQLGETMKRKQKYIGE